MARVNLDELVDGDWNRLVIACYGTNRSDIATALGGAAGTMERSGVQGAVVIFYFADDNHVVRKYNGDDGGLANPVPIDPCSRGGESLTKPLVIPRPSAILDLVRDSASTWWVLSPDSVA